MTSSTPGFSGLLGTALIGGVNMTFASNPPARISVGDPEQGVLFSENDLEPQDVTGIRRRVSMDEPLRIFVTSDYPIDKGRSASAERMLQTAAEFSRTGHEVVLFAPSYVERPKIAQGAKFRFRPIVFRPEGDRSWHSQGAPYVGFDIPVFDRNVQHSSRKLFSYLAEQQVDQLMRAYSTHLQLASLVYGRPHLVVTSHLFSIWNYVASAYPLLAFTSDSDHIPIVDGREPRSGIAELMREGAKRVYRIIASSRVTGSGNGNGYSEGRFDENEQRIYRVGINLDMNLFAHKGEPSKEEILIKYGREFKGLSMDKRWVVLYDRTGQPDIDRYISSLGAEILRTTKDVQIIVLREGELMAKASHVQRRARQFKVIDVSDDLNMKKMVLSAADASIIYIGGEGPPRALDRMERDTIIATQTALVLKEKGARRVFLPGALERWRNSDRTRIVHEMVEQVAANDFDRNSEHLPEPTKMRVMELIGRLAQNSTRGKGHFDTDPSGLSREEQKARQLAERARHFALRSLVAKRLVYAAGTGSVDERDPFLVRWQDSTASTIPATMESGIVKFLEPLFYEAALKGKLVQSPLSVSEPEYGSERSTRLEEIDYVTEMRLAHDVLVDDLGRENGDRDLLYSYGDWEDNVLRGLYVAVLGPTFANQGFFDPRVHPDGILSEITRLSGVPYAEVVKLAQRIERIPPERLLPKQQDSASRPPTAPPDDFGGSGNVVPLDMHRPPDSKR